MFYNYLPTVTASVVGQLPTDEHVDGFCVEHEVLGHLVEFKHSSNSVHCSCVNLSHGPQSAVKSRTTETKNKHTVMFWQLA